MPQEKKPRFTLGSADDLFTTQEMRDDAKLARIHEIPLDEIDEFPNHPYKVKDDEDMMNLVESIRENGVLTPATVRKKEDGRYEMLSGHRRWRACQLLGLETLRCEIVELDRDAATIFMCDSNLQRTVILPSEKAFAYKMRYEAMKRMPGRPTKENSATLLQNSEGRTSRELLAREVGESHEQVRKYIRLTELIPEILEMVDEGQIAMRPAVEISYLPKELQEELFENMEIEACTPSHDQAMRMKGLFKQGKLTPEVISAIMQEEKPNQREKVILRDERTIKLLPRDLPVSEREEYILKALEHYGRYLRKQRDLER